jgi:hypothetical protein
MPSEDVELLDQDTSVHIGTTDDIEENNINDIEVITNAQIIQVFMLSIWMWHHFVLMQFSSPWMNAVFMVRLMCFI